MMGRNLTQLTHPLSVHVESPPMRQAGNQTAIHLAARQWISAVRALVVPDVHVPLRISPDDQSISLDDIPPRRLRRDVSAETDKTPPIVAARRTLHEVFPCILSVHESYLAGAPFITSAQQSSTELMSALHSTSGKRAA